MSHLPSSNDTSSRTTLTEAQQAFLAALDSESQNGRRDREHAPQVEPSRLAEWLRSRVFRKRLRGLLRGMRQRRELCLQLAASRAAERLAAELDESTAAEAARRRAWIDLLKLVRQPRRRAAGARGKAEAEAAGVHPDVDPGDVADLLRRLG